MMTPKERAAMQQALEALETDEQWGFVNKKVLERRLPAITALREALDHSGEANEMVGCAYCNNPLFAGTKCNNCGLVTLAEQAEPNSTFMEGYRIGLAEMREKCAKVVTEHAPTCSPHWVSYVAAIRAIKFEGDTGFRPVSEMIAEHKQDPKKGAAIEKAKMRKATRAEKVAVPGVYEVPVEQAEREPLVIDESWCIEPKPVNGLLSNEHTVNQEAVLYIDPSDLEDINEGHTIFATVSKNPTKLFSVPLYISPQPVQDPVGYIDAGDLRELCNGNERQYSLFTEDKSRMVAVYAAPVRTKDLTDEELNDIWYGNTKDGWLCLFRAVIAADREKNRGNV